MEKWVGKTAVITGASSGIGAATFKEFAKAGINVIALDVEPEVAEAAIKEFGPTKGKTYVYKCDVSDPKSVTAAFKWIEAEFGHVNILVNNAGIAKKSNILDEGDEAFEKMNQVLDTNVRGMLQCTREAFRLMKKSDDYGLIINMNSIEGHVVPFHRAPLNIYAGTKHAVTAITETLRQELVVSGNKKIRVTSVSPSVVDTNFIVSAGLRAAEDAKRLATKIACLKPEKVAQAVMLILSTPYTVNVSELTLRAVGDTV